MSSWHAVEKSARFFWPVVMMGLFFGLLVRGSTQLRAQTARDREAVPEYAAHAGLSGVIEIWGSPGDGRLLDSWQNGFRRLQPGVKFVDKMYGPDSTMAGIYTGVAQIAFLSREIWPVETMAFQWVHQFPPTSVSVMTAALDNDRVSASLVVVVNKANPATSLSLEQLDGIFGAEHRRGGANIRTWGEAGDTGAWQNKSIHVYGPAIDSAPAYFFEQAVLLSSLKWNCDLKEFGTERNPELASVVRAVSADPDGIGYAVVREITPDVKALAISRRVGDSPVPPTEQNVRTRAYPLSRPISLYFSRKPGVPIDPNTKEFLLYILSRQGQQAIARDGGYLPLTPGQATAERARLQ